MSPLNYEIMDNKFSEEITSEGKIAVQYCFGQSCIWIPPEYGDKLGPQRILNTIHSVFTEEELERFDSTAIRKLKEGRFIICRDGSYEIELPSLAWQIGGNGFTMDPENKIPKIIELINQELIKL